MAVLATIWCGLYVYANYFYNDKQIDVENFLSLIDISLDLFVIIRAHNQYLPKRIKLPMGSHRDCHCNFRKLPLSTGGNTVGICLTLGGSYYLFRLGYSGFLFILHLQGILHKMCIRDRCRSFLHQSACHYRNSWHKHTNHTKWLPVQPLR